MKLWACLILLSCNTAIAQVQIQDGKVSANIVNQRLDTVLETFRNKTDIEFYVDDSVVDQAIYADFRNLPIAISIKKILEGTGINHAVIADREGLEAIFIGGSQNAQISSRKLDTRPVGPRHRQLTYPSPQNLKQSPVANPSQENKKRTPLFEIKPTITIPTAGGLTVSPPAKTVKPKSAAGNKQKDDSKQ